MGGIEFSFLGMQGQTYRFEWPMDFQNWELIEHRELRGEDEFEVEPSEKLRF